LACTLSLFALDYLGSEWQAFAVVWRNNNGRSMMGVSVMGKQWKTVPKLHHVVESSK
jgi:hypothetical protein